MIRLNLKFNLILYITHKSYCLKERKITESNNIKTITLENGGVVELSNCASCGIKKSRFITN